MVALTAPGSRAASSGWSATLLDQATPAGLAQAPLDPLRERATTLLATRPLPTRRQEDWRFTDPTLLTTIAPQLIEPGERGSAAADLPAATAFRLRLDGEPSEPMRLPEGIELIPPGQLASLFSDGSPGDPTRDHAGAAPVADPDRDWISLLVTATAPAPLALRVRAGARTSLELLSDLGERCGVLPRRLLLVLERDASLDLLQVHRAGAASLTALQLELRLAPGARLQHGLIGFGREAAALLADLRIRQDPASHYAFTSVVGSWGLSRIEPRVSQTEGAASTRLRALQRVDGREIADQHSQVWFGGPEGSLDQLHKAIASGAGRSVFNGAVLVPRLAQRTDAAQLSRSLLLSERARIDTKPQLEIVADDVRCAHGATVSRLQQEELFYLRSRGVSAATAAALLVRGFCEEVLRELPPGAALWQPQALLLGEEAPRP